MSIKRKPVFIAVGVVVVLVIGLVTLAWPNYAKLQRINREIDQVTLQIQQSAQQSQEIKSLSIQRDQAMETIETDFKHIPEAADIEELIRRLSLPIDQQTVFDQTFTAREPVSALEEEQGTELLVKPLDIEIRAVFDSVFAVVQAVESLDQLTRITSVHMAAEERTSPTEAPVLSASINVEAVFAPVREEEDK